MPLEGAVEGISALSEEIVEGPPMEEEGFTLSIDWTPPPRL